MTTSLLAKFDQVERYHWWWHGRRLLLSILIDHYGGNPQKLLDIGCGTGETLVFLKKTYPNLDLYGVDNSAEAIRYAKARKLKNICLGDVTHIPFPNASFDIVLLLDVLEHVKNDLTALKEIKRVLKPNGQLFLTVPALPFIMSAHDRDQGHKRRYTKRGIRKLVSQSHLTIGFVSYFNTCFVIPIIFIRLLSKTKWFSWVGNYDNKLNYDVAKFGLLNGMLKAIFYCEINAMRKITYPYGISIVATIKNQPINHKKKHT